MHCSQVKQQLDDFLDNGLSAIQHQAVNQHLSGCSQCQHDLEQAKLLLLELRENPVPAPENGFEERIFSVLDSEDKSRRRHTGFIAGFTSALAASLALWLVISPGKFTEQPDDSITDVTIQLSSSEVRQVNLMFRSPEELADATLTLQLDGDIELDGHPGRRQIQWKTALKKGSNRLSLPVRANGNRGGNLVASISRNGKTKTLRIFVTTGSNSGFVPDLVPATLG